ncbi:MAG: hypothetical protein JHD28_08235 [Bacteroidia bacterium]|nr:hypothetical protein [Bacteroidia bacterium]
MKKIKNTLLVGILIVSNAIVTKNATAQTKQWKTDVVDKGKISVKSLISERNEGDKTLPLIEYIATTVENVNYQKCILTIKDVSKHNQFLDLKTNFLVKKINENESVIYYCFSAPWPFTPTDCVAKMIFEEDKVKKTAVFTLTCAPFLHQSTDYLRFKYYHKVYTFKDLGNGKVEITINAKMSPPVSVPLWLIRSGFPDIAADIIRKFVLMVKY